MLTSLWNGLRAFAKLIGRVQAWLILTVFYFVLLAPVALIFKCVADPLRLRRVSDSIWTPRSATGDRWTWAKAQS